MRDEKPKKNTYDVPLPEALRRSLSALPLERQTAFHEQVVMLAVLFVNETPVLDFRDVRLDDLDREDKGAANGENPLLTFVLSQARMEWKSSQTAKNCSSYPMA